MDDIYIPMELPVPDTQNNPVTTAMVDSVTDPSNPGYTTAFLPVGTYTASLTSEAEADGSATIEPVTEDPAEAGPDNVLLFTGTTNAPVAAGDVTPVDFDGG